jgi:hypothetical protein
MASGVSADHRRPSPIAPCWFGSAARSAAIGHLARFLGALTLLGVGIDHIEQYRVDAYSAIPTIGTLFALNFAAATAVSVALLAPVRRLAGRWADAVLAFLAVSGIGIAVGALAGLLISERSGLFGFMEQGYRSAIVVSIVLEVATVSLLGLFLAMNGFGIRPRQRWIRRR